MMAQAKEIFKLNHRSPKRNASNGGLWLKYKSLYGDREFDIKIVQCMCNLPNKDYGTHNGVIFSHPGEF